MPAVGEPEINDINVRVLVGASTAYSRTFTVNVTDGTLNINFVRVADNAMVSGIEVIRIINLPPTVNAGADQNVQPNTFVQLNGTASDPEGGEIASLTWLQTAGPAVVLSDNTLLTPNFTPTVKGTYTFKLTATDSQGASSSDFVNIVVPNRAATVNVSATPSPAEVNATVALAAVANDPDGDVLTYLWQLVNGPQPVTIDGANTANASFIAAVKGTYSFRVTVSDGDTGGIVAPTVTVVVNNRLPLVTPSAAPAPAEVENTVTLAANASDPDGDTLTYTWSQLSGPQLVDFKQHAS
ncbi:MAG: PKD domain-containing protein [Gammaproteobacteria bacterium]|nr:PKD domain-containing protein [Gammaproteobacteria bacterium]